MLKNVFNSTWNRFTLNIVISIILSINVFTFIFIDSVFVQGKQVFPLLVILMAVVFVLVTLFLSLIFETHWFDEFCSWVIDSKVVGIFLISVLISFPIFYPLSQTFPEFGFASFATISLAWVIYAIVALVIYVEDWRRSQ